MYTEKCQQEWILLKDFASQAGTKKQQKRYLITSRSGIWYSPRVVSRTESGFDDSLAVSEHVELWEGHVGGHLQVKNSCNS